MESKKTNFLCILLALVMLLSLAACGVAGGQDDAAVPGEESAEADEQTAAPEEEAPAGQTYTNAGKTLPVPAEYQELLIIDMPENSPDGILFSVAEKASVEAAQAQGETFDGVGFLFSIGTVNEEKLHEMLCFDMSGAEPFAKDEDGNYYVYYHPTDVRVYRAEGGYEDEESMAGWEMLNEWAWQDVRDAFIQENGLIADARGNSSLEMYLARVAYQDGVNYTVSTTQYGPMEPGDVDPTPFVERLLTGVTYEYMDGAEAPDGEYVVLNFPDEDCRFDFFSADHNCVRMVWAGGNEELYRATFADGATQATDVMQEWYDALVEANGPAEPEAAESPEPSASPSPSEEPSPSASPESTAAPSPSAEPAPSEQPAEPAADALVGSWAEKYAGRGVITITKGSEEGKYNVVIDWSNSAFDSEHWEMTATAGEGGVLSYENGSRSTRTYDEDGSFTEEVHYENGSGSFTLVNGEIIWQDNIDAAGADTAFVDAD